MPVETRPQIAKKEEQLKLIITMLAQMDAKNREMDEKMTTRMEAMNAKMDARIKVMDKKLDAKME